MRRLIVLLLWLVFLWKGYGWHRERSEQQPSSLVSKSRCLSPFQKTTLPHGTANRAMPENWRISAQDIAGISGVNGRYTACPLSADDPVIERDLQDAPNIAPADGKLAYSFVLKSDSPVDRSLNAGMVVQVFEERGPALVTDARVLAVLRDDGFSAILEVTPAESQLLIREGSAKLRVIPRR